MPNFKTTIELDITVDYSVFGKHRPADRTDPEEFPEIEDVTVTVGGIDITAAISPAQMEQIIEECHNDDDDNKVAAAEARADAMEDR